MVSSLRPLKPVTSMKMISPAVFGPGQTCSDAHLVILLSKIVEESRRSQQLFYGVR